MIIWAIMGILTGSFINWAADYTPRFAADRALVPANLQPRWQLSVARPARSGALNVTVESLTALMFAYVGACYGLTWTGLSMSVLVAFFILIGVIDLKHRLVLNVLIYPAAIFVLIMHLITGSNWIYVMVGGAFGFVIFLAAAWLRPGDLGGGDIKLATLIGLLFGFPHVLWALSIGVVAGGLGAIGLLVTRRWSAKAQMPYAPFLCLGALIALFYNPLATIFHF
jgi:prepilin signal peptidase PulO-like enzyme (type II secretory pathway)